MKYYVLPSNINEVQEFYIFKGNRGDNMGYKERFKDEYYNLSFRVSKLRIMLIKWDNSELDFEPPCPRKIYEEQLNAMVAYLDVLKTRAKLENIDIEIKQND